MLVFIRRQKGAQGRSTNVETHAFANTAYQTAAIFVRSLLSTSLYLLAAAAIRSAPDDTVDVPVTPSQDVPQQERVQDIRGQFTARYPHQGYPGPVLQVRKGDVCRPEEQEGTALRFRRVRRSKVSSIGSVFGPRPAPPHTRLDSRGPVY